MELLTAAVKSAAATQQFAGLGTLHSRDVSTSVCGTMLEAEAAARSSDPEPVPPQLLNHPRYRVIRMLGRGGMGSVWLAEHLYSVESLALAPDGHHLASGLQDGTVRWWDLDTGAELRRVIAHPEGTLGVAVSPDSQYLLSGGKDGSVRLWRLSDRDAK